MQYCKNIESEEPIMLLDKHIGLDAETGMGIDASLFASELMEIDASGKKRIQVWINSIGGSVIDGYNICTAILKTKTKVDTYCVGIAASMAGVIFQCGRKRYMADYGILMYHNPFSQTGTANHTFLATVKESLNTIISEKSGMDTQAISLMMDRNTFINAMEAQTMNLCDIVESTSGFNKPRTGNSFNASAFHREAMTIVNNLLKPNNVRMKTVYNKLGLLDDANETSVLAAIESLQNKAKQFEVVNATTLAELELAKVELTEKQGELVQAEEKVTLLTSQLDAVNTEKEIAQAAARLEAAKATVKAFALQGRIKNDEATISNWAGKLVADETGIKALLESLPLNKAAVVIEQQEKLNPNDVGTSAAMLMAKVQNKLKGR